MIRVLIPQNYVWNSFNNPFLNNFKNYFDKKIIKCKIDRDEFWSLDFAYDIVHIHWPDAMLADMSKQEARRVIDRVKFLKSRGVKFICTIHNVYPHLETRNWIIAFYHELYSQLDKFIHLCDFSRKLVCSAFPHLSKDDLHIIIPHGAVYSRKPQLKEAISQHDALLDLELASNNINVFSFGQVRCFAELAFAIKLAFCLRYHGNYNFIVSLGCVPRVYGSPFNYVYVRLFYFAYLCCLRVLQNIPNTFVLRSPISEVELNSVLERVDVVWILRNRILNSGNVPLAFSLGKVVVGPNVGNVGNILNKYRNPVFSPSFSMSEIFKIVKKLQSFDLRMLGEKNRRLSQGLWDWSIVAHAHVRAYVDVMK